MKLLFRHSHQYNFGCSDIYIICHLKPKDTEQNIKVCELELSKCEWMPIGEYMNHDLVHETNRFFARKFLENRAKGVSIGLEEIELKIANFKRTQMVYSVNHE